MWFRVGMILLALALGAVSCGPSPQEQALNNTVTDLQAQLTDSSIDLEAAKAEVTKLTAELETTQTNLAAAQKAVTEAATGNEELTTLQSERDNLQAQLETLETNLSQAEKERDDLRAEVVESAEEIASLEQSSQAGADQLSDLEGQIGDLTKQLSDARTTIANLELNQVTTTANEELQSNVTDLETQVADLQTQLAVMQPRLEQLSRERDDLLNKLIASAEEIVGLKRQLNPETMEPATTEEVAEAPLITESELAALQTRLGQAEKERDDLRLEVASRAEEIATIEQNLVAATEAAETSTEVTSELETLQTRLAQLERERDDLLAKLTSSAEQIVRLKQTPQIALETMTSERDSLLAQASDLQGQLETIQAERNDLTAQLSTLTTQINVLNSTVNTGQQERGELQTQVTELQEQMTELQEQMTDREEENETLQTRAEALQRELDQAERERAEAEVTNAEAEPATPPAATEDAAPVAPTTSSETEPNSNAASENRATSENNADLTNARASASELNRTYERLLNEAKDLPSLSEAQQAQLESAQVALREAQQTVAKLSNARGIHTVLPGDSLSAIAAKFYGEGNTWPKVLEANQHLLGDNANVVYEGMVLVIPE